MLRKTIAITLAFIFLLSAMLIPTSAAEEKKLTFDENGKFRILQINDFQDLAVAHEKSISFLNSALDIYKPDLVVIVGDQIRDSFPEPTVDKLKATLSNQLKPIQDRKIPFLFTFGNHDRDYKNLFPMQEQAEYYRSYSYCYATDSGYDGGTYNTVIYSKDGTTPKLNIYMMDTNDWNGGGWSSGVTEEQVNWYVETSNALKELNGGKVLPSLVFQHIPVKEIHQLLKEVPAETEGALRGKYNDVYYIVNEEVCFGDRNIMREAPGSEHIDKVTGQYEAWLQQGDIIGAYFGHDHINTFVGKTKDGIVLGYNGGFGFATYGDPGERYAKIYDFSEDDIENYTQQTIYYSKCVSQETPEEPETPDVPEIPDAAEEKNCDHLCHKSGFVGFIWKIVQFFWKLFNMNPLCECGAEHY